MSRADEKLPVPPVGTRTALIRAAAVVAALAVASTVLGFVRETALAHGFTSSARPTGRLHGHQRYLAPRPAVAGLFTGMLQTQGNFTLPALSGCATNAFIILATVAAGPVFGIAAVAWRAAVAATAQGAIQLPALWRCGFRLTAGINWRDPSLVRVRALVVPVVLGSMVGQARTLVEKMLASGLAVATVLYPSLSRFGAAGDKERFRAALGEGVRMVNLLLVPISVGPGPGVFVCSVFAAAAMLWLLRGKLGHIGGSAVLGSLWRVVVASGLMAGAVEAVRRWWRAAWCLGRLPSYPSCPAPFFGGAIGRGPRG